MDGNSFWNKYNITFSIPNIGKSGKLVYVVITYVLLNVIYTAINIPYGVLNSLMT